MLKYIARKVFGTRSEKILKSLKPFLSEINKLEKEINILSDNELKAKTLEFKNKLKNGQTLDDIIIEAFAVVRETAKRVLGERHYDVQIIGGLVLHKGMITEMKTAGWPLAAITTVIAARREESRPNCRVRVRW